MERLFILLFFLTGFLAPSVTGSRPEAASDTDMCVIILSWGEANSAFCIPLLSQLNQALYITSSFSWNLRIRAQPKCMYATSTPIGWDARQSLYQVLETGSLWDSSASGTPHLSCDEELSVAIGCQDEAEPQPVVNFMAPPSCGPPKLAPTSPTGERRLEGAALWMKCRDNSLAYRTQMRCPSSLMIVPIFGPPFHLLRFDVYPKPCITLGYPLATSSKSLPTSHPTPPASLPPDLPSPWAFSTFLY